MKILALSLAALLPCLAAGPDVVRNGKRAVEHATRACELTSWKVPQIIAVLASAYAAAGEFDRAVEYHKQALSFAGFEKRYPEMRERLELYGRKQPYYNPAFAPRGIAPAPREVKQ